MGAFVAIFTSLCCIKKKTQSPDTIEKGNQTFSPETTKIDQTSADLHNKETANRDTNASNDDDNNANPELPLPPARKAELRGTYSCNNMTIQKSGTTKKKLSASLTIQVPRSLSMPKKRDGEEDKSVRKKKMKSENSILVRPIILGEKCRVLDDEEGGEDQSQRMPKNRIYHPRSLSLIFVSGTNSKINMNVIPSKETSEDLMEKEGK